MLCLLCGIATAEEASREPALAPRTEVTPGSVVIEAEPLELEPGMGELMRRFRARLADDRPLDPVEDRLVSGAIEVDTRYGRFCIAPLPTYLSSDLAGGLTLASRCAMF
ncbi:MAG TPA: hypothetical protein VFU53_00670 [Burkholderiales bacterium]|nr:hypothetical protein [Burkholderiales bacterium]